MILTTKEDLEKAILRGEKINTQTIFYLGSLEDEVTIHPAIGSLYKDGIYIGEYNGKEVVMMLSDEKEEMTWNDAMKLEHRRPLSLLEWQLYHENKEIIDEALKKYGKPLENKWWYWSSSENYNYGSAWVVRPSDGGMTTYGLKDNYNRVRCVLAF